jgi:2-amino-4-hydroxy-6-hydroxymethyldihydropteridine diphosphokinase
MTERVYLSLGSNVGDRAAHLKAAITRLGKLGRVAAVSSFYETEPVEVNDQSWFLNCVLALDTEEAPQTLLRSVLDIEREMGRQRTKAKGPRNIDIDILLFGEAIVNDKGLTIPHPAMEQRRFVLEPLSEIAPNARHPGSGKTAAELRDALGPGPVVRRVGKSDVLPD